MNFAQNLRKLRNERGLTQPELGKLFNVQKQTISSWEKGISTPDIYTLKSLAKYFSVSLLELIGENDGEQISIEKALEDDAFVKFTQLKLLVIRNAGIKNGAKEDDEVIKLLDSFASMSKENQAAFLRQIYKGAIKTSSGYELVDSDMFTTPEMEEARKEIDNLPDEGKLPKARKIMKELPR